MIDIKDFEEHLKKISATDWDKLFDLLPEMQQTEQFGEMKGMEKEEAGFMSLPFYVHPYIVNQFLQVVEELELLAVFDWIKWKEGKAIMGNNKTDFNVLDTVTLCKLFTVIIRADRFNEGFLIGNFADGTIQKIIFALQQHIKGREQP